MDEILKGILVEFVNIYFYGGCVYLVKLGELKIDVVFLGVFCCDKFGNVNGFIGKSKCGLLGYVCVDVEYVNKVVLLMEEFVEYLYYLISIV